MNGELNDLTRRLYAQGYTREHHPDTVCWGDWQNFSYKWETMLVDVASSGQSGLHSETQSKQTNKQQQQQPIVNQMGKWLSC